MSAPVAEPQTPDGGTADIHTALTADAVSASALEAARSVGAWTPGFYRSPITRRALRADLAAAADLTLAEEHLYWASELGRLTELASALNARCDLAVTRTKQARARVRTQLRAEAGDGRPPSQSALDDAAECHPEVVDAEEQASRLRLLAAHTAAAKEATAAYCAALSREITLRGDAKRARMG